MTKEKITTNLSLNINGQFIQLQVDSVNFINIDEKTARLEIKCNDSSNNIDLQLMFFKES